MYLKQPKETDLRTIPEYLLCLPLFLNHPCSLAYFSSYHHSPRINASLNSACSFSWWAFNNSTLVLKHRGLSVVAVPLCAPLPAPPACPAPLWGGQTKASPARTIFPSSARPLLHGNLPDFADVVIEMDHNSEAPAKLHYLHKHTVCSFGTAGLDARIASFHSAGYGTHHFQGGENHF